MVGWHERGRVKCVHVQTSTSNHFSLAQMQQCTKLQSKKELLNGLTRDKVCGFQNESNGSFVAARCVDHAVRFTVTPTKSTIASHVTYNRCPVGGCQLLL